MTPPPLLTPGTFVIGCNYWASHAGTNMWADWRPDVVEADFQQLEAAGLQLIRVFPLWPDFQPIHQLYTGAGQTHEIRGPGETLFPDDEAGRAGLSAEMLDRFATMCDYAQQHNLKLVVGLLTGWMSGRLFVPPALQGHNVLTDPLALMWEVRFVRCFVRRFKDHPAVYAWDLGNECNCMAPVPDHQSAWVWTAAITNAIRSEDRTRPVVSGMHSLDEPDENGPWRISDQAELTNVLTTHPYPYFTPHADLDPVNTIRTALHSTAQTRWYGDVGRVAAFCEETGTLGPMVCSDAVSADFLRTALFSLWANDCRGLLWWCAYDQLHLTHAPYDWHAFERLLGLFRVDRSPKPIVGVMQQFRQFVDGLPFETLPTRIIDAVCILTHSQEQWGAAYSAYVLAKQAGLEIEFQYADQPLKPAKLYLMPSVAGGGNMTRHFWMELIERVKAGATLYVSHYDCMISPFNEIFGVEVQTRQKRAFDTQFSIKGHREPLQIAGPVYLRLTPREGTEVLAVDMEGNPVFTRARLGEGHACFLSLPIETSLSVLPGAFHGPDALPFYQVYRTLTETAQTHKVIAKTDPVLGVTEHPLSDTRRVVVAVNYSPEPVTASLSLAPGWTVASTLRGDAPHVNGDTLHVSVPKNDAIVFEIQRQ